MDEKTFWNFIKTLIKENNMTQRGLSELCGFPARTIEVWVAKNRLPNVFEVWEIARALGVSFEYIITHKEDDQAKAERERLKAQLHAIIDTL